MLDEYHVTYSIRYYAWFHVTAVGLGTYYLRIWGPRVIITNLIKISCYLLTY